MYDVGIHVILKISQTDEDFIDRLQMVFKMNNSKKMSKLIMVTFKYNKFFLCITQDISNG